ncbi:MAG: DNA recombination protein RmuC [Sulfuricellaceae bacterium]|nr:DNA recombination protein RmuC [Sulfuricellaceae bacterium]
MQDILFGITALLVLFAFVWMAFKVFRFTQAQHEFPDHIGQLLEEKHRAMLSDLHDGLTKQGDRLNMALADTTERLRNVITLELKLTRESIQASQLAQAENLAKNREAVAKHLSELSSALQSKLDTIHTEIITKTLESLAEQGRAEQELFLNTMHATTQQLTSNIEALTSRVDVRLEQISGKVTERLEEGFKKTNETFANVMARLATIDEAQKKIDGLTTNVVSLQELLGDKRSRGAFGEVQLESLVRNVMPQQAYAMQHTLSNGSRADCVLFLPEPTGTVAVDSKFPLENYHRMFASGLAESDRVQAQKLFKSDVKKHVDAIGDKYIIPNETSDGAVMFIPAEAVFAEIHAYHQEVVEYAMQKRVWIVSPTTMMAVLNTARAVIKDVETRKQVHIIKDSLSKLGKEFGRFDVRMKKLADHIRLAHQDAEDVQVTSQKISRHFAQIENVEIDEAAPQIEEILPLEEGL